MSGLGEDVVKHLEMLQPSVTRLAQNSFACKAWAVALVSAIFALVTNDGSCRLVLIALLPALVFWGLDAYYLRQERLVRRLYNVVRRAHPDVRRAGAFSMDPEPYEHRHPNIAYWLQVCLSPTRISLYGAIVLVTLVFAVVLVCMGASQPNTH